MGVRLSELVSGTRTVDASFGDATVQVTYRLAERTLAKMKDESSDGPWLARVIDGWDITDDDGTPLPVTEESLDSIPVPILNAIVRSIYGDDGMGEAASS